MKKPRRQAWGLFSTYALMIVAEPRDTTCGCSRARTKPADQ